MKTFVKKWTKPKGLSQDQLNTPKEIWDMFDAQLDASLKINFRVHRLITISLQY